MVRGRPGNPTGAGSIVLTGRSDVEDSVQNGKATLMVQERPAYIAPSVDGKTTFAWLTDTPYLSASEPSTYNAETQWIVDHTESDHIAYTVHTGDLVDSVGVENQGVNADAAMQILDDAGMPYGVVSGNHDYESGYAHYRKYFGEDRFTGKPWYGGTGSDDVEHYDYISTPDADYMFVYLTWSATPAEWQWVKDAIASHPEANVILGVTSRRRTSGWTTSRTAAWCCRCRATTSTSRRPATRPAATATCAT